MSAFRLAGTLKLTLTARSSKIGADAAAAMWKKLGRKVAASCAVDPNRKTGTEHGVRTWNGDGEPGAEPSTTTVSRLLQEVLAGSFLVEEQHGLLLLEALLDLIEPSKLLWNAPFVRVAIPLPAAPPTPSQPVELTMFVYVGR